MARKPRTFLFEVPHHAWGKESACVADHPIYQQLGASSEQRQHAYRELFRHLTDNKFIA